MPKFVLHIGDGKCGSSAIQAALFDARAELAKIGIAYDAHQRTGGNYSFGTLIGKRTRGNDRQQRQLAEQVVARLRQIADTAGYVIISSESFLSMDPDDVIEILGMISDDITSIDTVAYVRNPLSMYLSLAQQSVKASHRFPSPDKYDRPINDFVAKWRGCSLVNSVTVRLFDRTTLVGHNVVADFEMIVRRLTGIDAIQLEHIDENTSLSAEQMVVMQDFRRRFHGKRDNRWTPDTTRLINFFTSMNEGGVVGHKPELSLEASAWIAHRSQEITTWLNEECGVAIDTATHALLPEGIDWSKVHNILAKVDRDTMRQLKMLVPAFNPAIMSGDLEAASVALNYLSARFPANSAAIARAANAFWKDEASAGKLAGNLAAANGG